MCDRFLRKFDVQTSIVNSKFPRGTYHTIVPSIEELYCLIIGESKALKNHEEQMYKSFL